MRMVVSNPAQEWMVKAMHLTPSLVEQANNSIRYCRPDMYLGTMNFNRQAYMNSLVKPYGTIGVNMLNCDPAETVPVMVRNLVGANTTMAMWHKLAK